MDPGVAGAITDRMANGEYVKPNNKAEQICVDLIKDLDAVSGHVKRSVTSKKIHVQSTAFFNAPTWFNNLHHPLALYNLHHPLALYCTQTDMIYCPERTLKEQNLLMSKNPVSAAHFFHFMVQAFLMDVLG
ncbi:hypothetical protein B0H17DRAFT_914813 [Mycena rosella]|uniref:Helitron helicase-like domain-containing protein n=1 Tax=Mycena rosella TaxID=1033263 RepID=A0AAD7MCR6_MYCRO|nr:hypothetical protein B0H17DRAFT_914813 [Mycena rosella]